MTITIDQLPVVGRQFRHLAARVHDLRNHGYQILDRWDGPTKRYWMEGKQ